MALFRRIQEYIALDANDITLIFDSGNIVNISGNIFLYPPQGHPILYNYYPYRAFGGQNKIVYSQALWQGGQYFLILPGQYFFNIARTLCDQSFPRIALCPAHLSYCCYVPQAFAFVRWQNGSRQSPTIVR